MDKKYGGFLNKKLSAVSNCRPSALTSLVRAAEYNDAVLIKRLLETGADVNAADKYGNTALHWIAVNGNAEIIRLLIKTGVSVNIKNSFGNMPLHLALSHGRADCVHILLAAGADVNARNEAGWTPLHYAASYGTADCIRPLIVSGARPDVRNCNGETAIDILEMRHPELYAGYIGELMDLALVSLKLSTEDSKEPAGTGFEFDI